MVLILVSHPNCSNASSGRPEVNATIVGDPALERAAAVLAGTAGVEAGDPVLGSAPYGRYVAAMDRLWTQIEHSSVIPIRNWREANVPTGYRHRSVTYFLSGVDFLNPNCFFPDAPEYLLVAMEPPGRVPSIGPENMERIFESMLASLQWFARYNYFTTVGMASDISRSELEGAVPVFLFFVARLGHTPLSLEYFNLSEEGVMEQSDREQAQGVRIRFRDRDGATVHDLIYLRALLRNSTILANTSTGRFLGQHRAHRAYILKAAEYFFHLRGYEPLRQFVLSSADLVIEDDSGIPLRDFPAARWMPGFFGEYVRPVSLGGLPNPPFQADLAGAFRAGARPIAFPYGYGSLRHPERSNLILFLRRLETSGRTGLHLPGALRGPMLFRANSEES